MPKQKKNETVESDDFTTKNKVLELPFGWTIAHLSDLALIPQNDIVDGPFGSNLKANEYKEDGIPIIRLQNINRNFFINKNIKFVNNAKAIELNRHSYKRGDIVITKLGNPLGKACLVPDDFEDGIIVADVVRFRPYIKYVNKKFVLYEINSPQIISQFERDTKGTTRQRVNLSHIRNLTLIFPPFLEQQRIVNKIEELFTKLDFGIEELKAAKAQIKRYRQSVLKYAYEGKLTEEWRKKNATGSEPATSLLKRIKEERKKALGSKYKELPAVDTTDLPELPEGWGWESISNITTFLGDGLHGTPNFSENGEYYFINGNNLSDGKIEIKGDTKRVSYEEYTKHKKALNGRTVFVSINGTLGNTAFYRDEKVVLGKSACYFNLVESLNKYFIRYYITSQRFIDYANKTATGSTIKNVSLQAMRECPVPIPLKIEEQEKIVLEIEKHFSVADASEKAIDESLIQTERLRQSVLKQAFEGKLVPQDPTDEPASILLERIKAERDAKKVNSEKVKRKRRIRKKRKTTRTNMLKKLRRMKM